MKLSVKIVSFFCMQIPKLKQLQKTQIKSKFVMAFFYSYRTRALVSNALFRSRIRCSVRELIQISRKHRKNWCFLHFDSTNHKEKDFLEKSMPFLQPKRLLLMENNLPRIRDKKFSKNFFTLPQKFLKKIFWLWFGKG